MGTQWRMRAANAEPQRVTLGLVMEGVRVRSVLPGSPSAQGCNGHANRGRARRLCTTCQCARTPVHHALDQPRAPCAARQARAARGAARITPACLLCVLLVAAQAGPAQGAVRVEDVLAEMRRHPADVGVQEQGCGALWSLDVNADNKVKIAAAGGIADVLAAMRGHRSHAGVQEQGCGALFNLALHADNQVKIAAAGGIVDVLEAMRAHKGTNRVEDFACRALHKLGQSVDGNVSKALLESGAVPVVRAATSEGCKRWGQQMIDRLQERGAEL